MDIIIIIINNNNNNKYRYNTRESMEERSGEKRREKWPGFERKREKDTEIKTPPTDNITIITTIIIIIKLLTCVTCITCTPCMTG
jgi:hypothetical protein